MAEPDGAADMVEWTAWKSCDGHFLRNIYYAIHQVVSSRLSCFSPTSAPASILCKWCKLISANLSLAYRSNRTARKSTCTMSLGVFIVWLWKVHLYKTFHHLSTVTWVLVPRQCGKC
jgi:membrane-anchored protein YejM (alkaline phosphatase superfamily)